MARGRPRTDPTYVRRVGVLAEEGHKPPEITRIIEEEAKQASPPRKDYPSERTVRRLYEAHRQLPPMEHRQEALFTWPDSMEDALLPWEAAHAALELLRFREVGQQQDGLLFRLPTIREAKWFWRLQLAMPGMPVDVGSELAMLLALREYGRLSRTDLKVDASLLVWWLAFRGWADDATEASHYARAFERRGLRPGDPRRMWFISGSPPDSTLELISQHPRQFTDAPRPEALRQTESAGQ